MISNVQPIFSDVPFFLDVMIFQNFQAPSKVSDILFSQISWFHIFCIVTPHVRSHTSTNVSPLTPNVPNVYHVQDVYDVQDIYDVQDAQDVEDVQNV